jgi:hypothetical protein
MLLALIVWIGGIIFFAFVEAPVLFAHGSFYYERGSVIRASLASLHAMGIVAGIVFLVCSVRYSFIKHLQLRIVSLLHGLVVLMLVLTGISQFAVTPKIHTILEQTHFGVEIPPETDNYPNDPSFPQKRNEFNRLHTLSTKLEGGVLFLGLSVVALTARRFEDRN